MFAIPICSARDCVRLITGTPGEQHGSLGTSTPLVVNALELAASSYRSAAAKSCS
jgi:hypothetical protein